MTRALTSSTALDGMTVTTIVVDIDLSNASQVHEELLRAVVNDSSGLIVDLSGVRYVDSAGVRVLFELARELEVSRQVMGLVVPLDSPIRRLVKITRLDEVAVLSHGVEDCLRALRP